MSDSLSDYQGSALPSVAYISYSFFFFILLKKQHLHCQVSVVTTAFYTGMNPLKWTPESVMIDTDIVITTSNIYIYICLFNWEMLKGYVLMYYIRINNYLINK